MTFIPAPAQTFLVNWVGSLRGQECVNTMHVVGDSGVLVDATLCNDLFNAFKSSWLVAPASFPLSVDYTLERCTVRDVEVEGGAEAISTVAPVAGGSASHALPNEVALVVSMRSGLAGRSNRGRLYLPAIPVGFTDGVDLNRLDSAHVGTANTSAAAFIAAILATNCTPVITSYYHDRAPRSLAVNTAIVAGVVNGRLDSQRRRMPRS